MAVQSAVAAFVKTPGITLAKTRLAAGKGRQFADEFYLKSIQCICAWGQELTKRDSSVRFHLAVAESLDKIGSYWQGYATVPQGEGGLAERMSSVYAELLTEADRVALIGMDAPQLDLSIWRKATELADNGHDFVLGPASDGGFYLLLGMKPIALELWQSVPYSAPNTFKTLKSKLEKLGRVGVLTELTDGDHAEDMEQIASELEASDNPSEAQKAMLEWLRSASGCN